MKAVLGRTWRRLLGAALLMLLLAGCAVTPVREVPRTVTSAWGEPGATRLGQAAAAQLASHPGQSGFHLLESGMDALSMRAGLAETAERTLDLQYYTLHEDTTTGLLVYRLLKAAQRGVRVRLLVDDMYAAGRDLDFAALSSHPQIEVRLFNPFLHRGASALARAFEFFGDGERLNRRMHNKLWIADNAAAIVGGRNLGDEYFDAGARLNFADLDLLAVGPVVGELSRSFDAYWNSPDAVPVEAFVAELPDGRRLGALEHKLQERLRGFADSPYVRSLREARFGLQLAAGELPLVAADAVALYDPPDKSKPPPEAGAQPVFSPRLYQTLVGARSELLLITPYFIPADEGVAVLEGLARRGVRVRILTNSLASSDVPVVHAAYARVRLRLLAAGIELHEMRREERPDRMRPWRAGASSTASLHSKAIVVDRRHVLVGSMNLDPRSRKLNTEVAVLLDSPALGSALATRFEQAAQPDQSFRVVADPSNPAGGGLNWIAAEGDRTIRHLSEPASAWRRLLAEVLRLFTPEEYL